MRVMSRAEHLSNLLNELGVTDLSEGDPNRTYSDISLYDEGFLSPHFWSDGTITEEYIDAPRPHPVFEGPTDPNRRFGRVSHTVSGATWVIMEIDDARFRHSATLYTDRSVEEVRPSVLRHPKTRAALLKRQAALLERAKREEHSS